MIGHIESPLDGSQEVMLNVGQGVDGDGHEDE